MDSRLRGNDEINVRVLTEQHWSKASLFYGSSFPRKRESMQPPHLSAIITAQWIPACAGMTKRKLGMRLYERTVWYVVN
jgi:hypothetical protein